MKSREELEHEEYMRRLLEQLMLMKAGAARAMRAVDKTEGPTLPLRPTLNERSSLARLMEITRTRGLQNVDFGQKGMSSVKSAAASVMSAKDPDEKGNMEQRPTLRPESSLLKLLRITQTHTSMGKSAADVSLEAAAAKEAIKAYEASLNPETLKAMAEALQLMLDRNPVHLNGGFYTGTKDVLSRANEMTGRGNTVRGFIGKYFGTPIAALGETLLAPATAIGRAASPSLNFTFDTPDELAENDPADKEHNVRAANELLKLLAAERPDPTQLFEYDKYLTGQFKNNTGKTIAQSAASLGLGSYIPYVNETIGDLLAAPHTALFNALGWNGKSRKEWEDEKTK